MNNNKIYELVTERVISLLENGVAPWRKPWRSGRNGKFDIATNIISKKPYRGVNFFITNCAGFVSPLWGTYKQIQAKGGQVKKGEKGTPIVFWKELDYSQKSENGETSIKIVPMLRLSYIFNVEQCENIDYENPVVEELPNFGTLESCENVRKKFPLGMPEIRHGGGQAYYNPTFDYINMPYKEQFENLEFYYQTLFHESIHCTGHKNRLNRDTLTQASFFGDTSYSQEELVAEMGASYLAAIAGIDSITMDNSASYLQGWLSALKKDNKLLIKSASQAQKAVDFLVGKQTEEDQSE